MKEGPPSRRPLVPERDAEAALWRTRRKEDAGAGVGDCCCCTGRRRLSGGLLSVFTGAHIGFAVIRGVVVNGIISILVGYMMEASVATGTNLSSICMTLSASGGHTIFAGADVFCAGGILLQVKAGVASPASVRLIRGAGVAFSGLTIFTGARSWHSRAAPADGSLRMCSTRMVQLLEDASSIVLTSRKRPYAVVDAFASAGSTFVPRA